MQVVVFPREHLAGLDCDDKQQVAVSAPFAPCGVAFARQLQHGAVFHAGGNGNVYHLVFVDDTFAPAGGAVFRNYLAAAAAFVAYAHRYLLAEQRRAGIPHLTAAAAFVARFEVSVVLGAAAAASSNLIRAKKTSSI